MDDFDELVDLYKKYGTDKYMINETITQINHILLAAKIANLVGAPEWMIIGLLCHDVGQLVNRVNDETEDINKLHWSHDDRGAAWLKTMGFSTIICDFVKYHTYAKILLCRENSMYFEHLSDASKDSYYIQREKYSNCEIDIPIEYKAGRMIDDMSKFNDVRCPGIETYRDMFSRVKQQIEKPYNKKWIDMVQELHNIMIFDTDSFLKYIS